MESLYSLYRKFRLLLNIQAIKDGNPVGHGAALAVRCGYPHLPQFLCQKSQAVKASGINPVIICN